MSYQQLLTDLGRDVIAIGQTGETITFTRMVLGQGTVTPSNIPSMTAMVSPVMEAQIVSVARTAVGQATITGKILVTGIPYDFAMSELGVFATVNGQPEVLYTVSYSVGVPDQINQEMGGPSTFEFTLSVAVLIGTTEDVTAIFVPDIEIINIGTIGAGWYSNRIANTFRFKRAIGDESIIINEDANAVRFTAGAIVPIGGMIPYTGDLAPSGWFICDGRTLLRLEFPRLFAVCGTRYGVGDGSTTFNIPDMRDRTAIGASTKYPLASRGGSDVHVLSIAEMAEHRHVATQANHTHQIQDLGHIHGLVQNPHSHHTTIRAQYGFAPGTIIGGAPSNVVNQVNPGVGGTDNSSVAGWPQDMAVIGLGMHAAVTNISIIGNGAPITISDIGSNQPHNNMQPYLSLNWIVRADF